MDEFFLHKFYFKIKKRDKQIIGIKTFTRISLLT